MSFRCKMHNGIKNTITYRKYSIKPPSLFISSPFEEGGGGGLTETGGLFERGAYLI